MRCWSSSSTAPRPRSSTSSTQVEQLCREHGAFEIRIAADDAERALFWKGRKSAFAAVGRISPDYIVQDGVIPRTALPEVLRRIGELSGAARHPGGERLPRRRRQPAPAGAVRRRRSPAQAERAEEVSGAILDLCIEHGGSITGEHGVGVGQGQVHAADVHRRRPGHDAAGPVRVRPRRPGQPRQDLPHAPALRRGPRAGARASTRCRRPGWRSVLMGRVLAATSESAARRGRRRPAAGAGRRGRRSMPRWVASPTPTEEGSRPCCGSPPTTASPSSPRAAAPSWTGARRRAGRRAAGPAG